MAVKEIRDNRKDSYGAPRSTVIEFYRKKWFVHKSHNLPLKCPGEAFDPGYT